MKSNFSTSAASCLAHYKVLERVIYVLCRKLSNTDTVLLLSSSQNVKVGLPLDFSLLWKIYLLAPKCSITEFVFPSGLVCHPLANFFGLNAWVNGTGSTVGLVWQGEGVQFVWNQRSLTLLSSVICGSVWRQKRNQIQWKLLALSRAVLLQVQENGLQLKTKCILFPYWHISEGVTSLLGYNLF